MASNYLSSNLIRVYPSALRGGTDGAIRDTIYDPESRIGTEFNLTNAVNRLTIGGSFVIDAQPQNGWLQFSIHGYYFMAQLLTPAAGGGYQPLIDGLSDATSIYANIKLTSLTPADTGATYKLMSLGSWDGQSEILDVETSGSYSFKGVYFTSQAAADPSHEDEYSLLLLQKTDSGWVVPATSYLRFDSMAVAVGNTPLGDILSEAGGEITMDVDHASIGDASFDEATIGTLHNGSLQGIGANPIQLGNTVLQGTKATIDSGLAGEAVAISDANGNLRTTGSNHPIYLSQGVPTELVGSIGNDTTGNAATATALQSTRQLKTALGINQIEGGASFNGTANQLEIPVTGVLQPANGGTGQNDLDKVTAGYTKKIISNTTNIGGYVDAGGTPKVYKSGTVMVKAGVPQEGITIFSSTRKPQDGASGDGKPGDIWLQFYS